MDKDAGGSRMNAAWKVPRRVWQRKQTKPYVIKVNEQSGTVYLERERHPLLVELPYVAALVITVVFAILSCFQYIQLKTDVEVHIRQMEVLERQLHNLQNANTLAEKDITYLCNLNDIYETATQSLGMVPAAEANILFYERSDSCYVYQRDNIPFIGY